VNKLGCFKVDCPFRHPDGWRVCFCTDASCTVPAHPPFCKQAGCDGECGRRHGDGVQRCRNGIGCFKTDCPFDHPKGWRVCFCVDPKCKVAAHPPFCKKVNCDGKSCGCRHKAVDTREYGPECQNKGHCCMRYLGRDGWLPQGTDVSSIHHLLCSNKKACKSVYSACKTHHLRLRDAKIALEKASGVFCRNHDELKKREDVIAQLQAAHDELVKQQIQFLRIIAELFSQPTTLDKPLINRLYRELFRVAPFNRDGKSNRVNTKPLPALAFRDDILQSLQRHQIIIVQGQTGSGKSTQLPQYLAEISAFGKICVTQPRKVSAVELAARVAYEFSGGHPQYSQGTRRSSKDVRFSGGVAAKPGEKITFMTESTMLKQLLLEDNKSSPLPWNTVVLDEAHERSIQCDLLLGLLKHRVKTNPNLRVVVTSATLDAKKFQGYFTGVIPLIKIPGRMFPVEKSYIPISDTKDIVQAAVSCAWKQHSRKDFLGDILVFLTGQYETERAVKMFRAHQEHFERKHKGNLPKSLVLALYGKQLPEDQAQVFTKPPVGTRKIVFSTNVAETGVTVDGVRMVVDTGLCKEYTFDAKRNLAALSLKPISQSSATQRAGRAGRTAPGECIRLYSQEDFEKMRTGVIPEIQRASLGLTIISLLRRGIDVTKFDFIDPPDPDDIAAAIRELEFLGAVRVDKSGGLELTKFGTFASEFEMDVKLARILFLGAERGQWEWAATLAALITTECNVFYRAGDAKKKSESAKRHDALLKDLNSIDTDGDVVCAMKVFYKWDTLDEWWEESNEARIDQGIKAIQKEEEDALSVLDDQDNSEEHKGELTDDALQGLGSRSMLQDMFGALTKAANEGAGFFARMEGKQDSDVESVASSTSLGSQLSLSSSRDRPGSSTSNRSRRRMHPKKKLKLQKKWAWANSLNSKALAMTEKARYTIVQTMKNLDCWGDQKDSHILKAKSIHSLFFGGFFLNYAQLRHKNMYFTAGSSVGAYLTSSSSLAGTSSQSVCYLKVMKTTRSFLQVASPVFDLEACINEVVPELSRASLRKLIENSSSECIDLGAFSWTVIRSAFGKRMVNLSQFERELRVDIEIVTNEEKKNHVRVWGNKGKIASAAKRLKCRLDGCIQKLLDEECELQMVGTTRAVFGAGGVIRNVLLGQEFQRVNFLNLPSQYDDGLLQSLLTKTLNFKKSAVKASGVEPTQESIRTFGWATFCNPDDAKRCVKSANGMLLDSKTTLRCKRGGASHESYSHVSDIDVVLSWATAPSKCCGTVSFATAQGANLALAMYPEQTRIDIKSPAAQGWKEKQDMSKKAKAAWDSGDKDAAKRYSDMKKAMSVAYDVKAESKRGFKIFVNKLDPRDDEHALINRFSRCGTIVNQFVVRDPSSAHSNEQKLAEVLLTIRSIAYAKAGECLSDVIFPADEKSHRARMQCRMESLTAAKSCLDRVKGLASTFLHNQPIRAEVKLTHHCRLHGDMYQSLEPSFQKVFQTARENGVRVWTTVRGKGKKSWARVSLSVTLGITGSDTKLEQSFRQTKRAVNTLLVHRVFEHKSSNLLFTQMGRKYMEHLSKLSKGFIHWYRRSVRLYGTEANVEILDQALKDWIEAFEATLSSSKIFIDRKAIRKTRKCLSELQSCRGVANAQVSGRVLELLSNKEGKKNAEEFLKKKSISVVESKDVRNNDCAEQGTCFICFCDVENGFTLSLCGHVACSECLQNQVKALNKDRGFPMTCSNMGCGKPIAWSDIHSICDEKLLGRLTTMSYLKFKSDHLNKYSNCFGVDCDQIFPSDAKEVYCDQCDEEYCMTCCMERKTACPSHPGYKCKDLDPSNEDAMLAKVLGERMAPCPKCGTKIEKNGGCGKMICTVCKTCYCWFCMKIFLNIRTKCTCPKHEGNAWFGGQDVTCRYIYHHMSHCTRPVHKVG